MVSQNNEKNMNIKSPPPSKILTNNGLAFYYKKELLFSKA